MPPAQLTIIRARSPPVRIRLTCRRAAASSWEDPAAAGCDFRTRRSGVNLARRWVTVRGASKGLVLIAWRSQRGRSAARVLRRPRLYRTLPSDAAREGARFR